MYKQILFTKTSTNYVTMDQFFLDFRPKEMFRQVNFKFLNGNTINISITTKRRLFLQEEQQQQNMEIESLTQKYWINKD